MIFSSIQYNNEHLFFGELGQLAIFAAFAFSLISALSYFFATQSRSSDLKRKAWTRLGRISFSVHGISILLTMGLIFYIMLQKHYEYAYVFDHVSDELPFRYLLSAFWEGQEGSFLLWAFWHIVLGWILMAVARKWEAPVISVISVVQFFIISMLLGIYLTNTYKLGINPFVLLRDTVDAPIFANADYLQLIEGRGLNALLQNYWMTIHPPVLFLGFASTTIPFAYAVAGLWTKQYKAWLKPTWGWAAFSGGILGLGILMGGAWAYEALTFGGYWAWDPVENMSLVPWLMLVAGLHTHLVAKATGHSLRASFVFYILTFALVVYSTFLVRSGILEDTSVHAFVESGLEKQLLVYLLFFPIAAFSLFAARYRSIPSPSKEEALSSREFWMFVGILVLTISSILITFSTSLPVFNTIIQFFNPEFEPMVVKDPVPHYNKNQLWIAVLIGLVSGFAQWLRFRERNFSSYQKRFWTHIAIAGVGSLVLSYISLQWLEAYAWQYRLLLFAGIFTVVANLDYLISFFRKQPKAISSVLSHSGFGIMIVGILFSGLNQETISTNMFAQRGLLGLDDETLQSNVVLLKGSPMEMRNYRATYVSDTMDGRYRTYDILFERKDSVQNDSFLLRPNIIYNKDFTKVEAYNPDTRRKWNYDVFMHLSGLPPQEMNFQEARALEDSLDYMIKDITLGDTLSFQDHQFTFSIMTEQPEHPDYDYKEGDQTVGLNIKYLGGQFTNTEEKECFLLLREGYLFQYAAYFPESQVKFKLPETFADRFFKDQTELDYDILEMKEGDSSKWNGYTVHFKGVIRQPNVPHYSSKKGDIALGADLRFSKSNSDSAFSLQPVYYIRGKTQQNAAHHSKLYDISARFVSIDPSTSSFTFAFSKGNSFKGRSLPIKYATEVPRSDYIVISAVKMPGINLFWLGSCLMLIGLFVSMFLRWKNG
jgi:cytochrome c-type biogenesis protein CcmF